MDEKGKGRGSVTNERFQDKLIHHYFSIKPSIVWQIIQKDLPVLKTVIEKLLKQVKHQDEGNQQL